MATIHICDRCKQQKPKSDLQPMTLGYVIESQALTKETLGEFCSTCQDAVRRFARGDWQCPEQHIRVGDPDKGQMLFFPLRSGGPDVKCHTCPKVLKWGDYGYTKARCEGCDTRFREDRVNTPG